MDQELPRRLDKFLADAQVGSRTDIRALGERDAVRVNGRAHPLDQLVDPQTDVVEVEGVRVTPVSPSIYMLMNKPAGVLTARSDPRGRRCIGDLVPEAWSGIVAPVGRLDRATTGALLMTDDGDLNNLMTHPDFHVWKRYILTVIGEHRDSDLPLEKLREGIVLNQRPTRPARCGVVPDSVRLEGAERQSQLWIEISEGRNRQVRRMARRVHLRLLQLHRASIGPLSIEGVAEGEWRALSASEIDALYEAAGGREAPIQGALRALKRRLEAGTLSAAEAERVERYFARGKPP